MAYRETGRHREAFFFWHDANRNFRITAEKCGVSDDTVRRWADRYGWHDRADKLDAEADARARREALRRQAAMLDAHRQLGQVMRVRAAQHFAVQDMRIQFTKDAVAAARTGVEIERTAEGLPTWLMDVLSADPETLRAELAATEAALGRRAAPKAVGDPEDPAGSWGAGRDPDGHRSGSGVPPAPGGVRGGDEPLDA